MPGPTKYVAPRVSVSVGKGAGVQKEVDESWFDRDNKGFGVGMTPPCFPIMAEAVVVALIAEGKHAVYVEILDKYYRAYAEYLSAVTGVGAVPANASVQGRVKSRVQAGRLAVPVKESTATTPLTVGWLRSNKCVGPRDCASDSVVASYDGGCYLHFVRKGYVQEVYARLGGEPDFGVFLGLPSAAFVHSDFMARRVCAMVDGRIHVGTVEDGSGVSFLDVLMEYGKVAELPSWARELTAGRVAHPRALGVRPGIRIGSSVPVPAGFEAVFAALPRELKSPAERYYREAADFRAKREVARASSSEPRPPQRVLQAVGVAVGTEASAEVPVKSQERSLFHEPDLACHGPSVQGLSSSSVPAVPVYSYKVLFKEAFHAEVVASLGPVSQLTTVFAFPIHYYVDSLENWKFSCDDGRVSFGYFGSPILFLMRSVLDHVRDLKTYPVLARVKSKRLCLADYGLLCE